MTDRIAGFVVALADDVREDDAKAIYDAIAQLRGVGGVGRITSDPSISIAQIRERNRLSRAVLDMLETLRGET